MLRGYTVFKQTSPIVALYKHDVYYFGMLKETNNHRDKLKVIQSFYIF